jgi:hypothetical protein
MVGGGKYTFELVGKDKAEFKALRRELIGVSDGDTFYISDKFTIKGWQGLTPCILSGPYVIAPVQGSAGQYTGGGIVPAMIKVGKGFLIDIRDGTSVPLSNKTLKRLLSKYPDIAAQYKDKQDLSDYSVDIVEQINQAKFSH